MQSERDEFPDARSTPEQEPSSGWLTKERTQVHTWLQLNAPHLAEVYLGSVRLFEDEEFPGRVYLVAHAVREIRNRLPDAIAGVVAKSNTEYNPLVSALHESWIAEGLPEDGSIPLDAPNPEPNSLGPIGRTVSSHFISAVGDVIVGHVAAGKNNDGKARRLFEQLGGEPVPSYVIRNWTKGTRSAVELTHVKNKELNSQHIDDLAAVYESFEAELIVITSRSYENMDTLDDILASANRLTD